ncbi:MAG: hypothetical protein KatS3mg022_2833 [Armatimonadota bacterium]|nr:MAG: hypothetical protein KatS3mg022_2833 [Armatimonadota bacterium]
MGDGNLAERLKPALNRAADAILQRQHEDGAILMAPAAQPVNSLVPYFANLAAIGLAAAYPHTHNKAHLQAVERWVHWYAAHLNPDGTMDDYRLQDGKLQPTGDCDSTDSYAATFLEALHRAVQASLDRRLLTALYPAARKAVGGIRLTLQEDGLTWAKPSYRVKYLMDNVEVYRGWQSAAWLAQAMGRKSDANSFKQSAERTLRAIEGSLFSQSRGYYAWVMHEDGVLEARLERWYPDVMAQLMAIAWLPPSTRRKGLFARLRKQFGDSLQSALEDGDAGVLVWWGMAAIGAGDRVFAERIALEFAEERVLSQMGANPAEYGHVLRICAAILR